MITRIIVSSSAGLDSVEAGSCNDSKLFALRRSSPTGEDVIHHDYSENDNLSFDRLGGLRARIIRKITMVI